MMCEWCGTGIEHSEPDSSSKFCSTKCRLKNIAFHAKQGAVQLRRTDFSHVLSNWKALPKSRKQRIYWLKNTFRTAWSRSLALARGAVGRRRAARIVPKEEKVTETSPAKNDSLLEAIGEPWKTEGLVEIWSGPSSEGVNLKNGTAVEDSEIRLDAIGSLKILVEDQNTTVIRFDQLGEHFSYLLGLTGFGVSIFMPEPLNVAEIGLWIFSRNGGRFRWSVASDTGRGFESGWNFIRFPKNAMLPPFENPGWGQVSAAQIFVKARSSTTFNVGNVWAETRPKASLLFIHDGGYAKFDQSPGYRDLSQRKIPVTWSIDCNLIGDVDHVTRERLIEIGDENRNSISFHGWDGAISNNYTSDVQARVETEKCQHWIQQLPTAGNTGWKWRTAWMQNRSPRSPASDDLVLANPMWDPNNLPPAGATMWPLVQPYNYHRQALHQLSERSLKMLFEEARDTHGVLVCYTHNVGPGQTNISPPLWKEFLRHVDKGITEGWLEGVTFEILSERSFGQAHQNDLKNGNHLLGL